MNQPVYFFGPPNKVAIASLISAVARQTPKLFVCLLTYKQTNTYTVLQMFLKAIQSTVPGNIPTHSKVTENLRCGRILEAKGFLKETSVYDNAEQEFPKGWEAHTAKPHVLVV